MITHQSKINDFNFLITKIIYFFLSACWDKDSACRPSIREVIEDLNNINISNNILEDEVMSTGQINYKYITTTNSNSDLSNMDDIDNLK